MKSVTIFGATSAIATECARQWVAKGVTGFNLIGRDQDALNLLGNDLVARRKGVTFTTHVGDLATPHEIDRIVTEVVAQGIPDIVLIAQGTLPDQQRVQQDLGLLAHSFEINALSPTMCAEAFVEVMTGTGGTIAVIGSVAGDRGRQSNYAYGAAKAMLDTYVRGMQHRLYRLKLNVLLIKPGPVNTPMTAGLGMKQASLASVSIVAKDILRAISAQKSVVYTPGKWRIIMWIVRSLPSALFNRTSL